MSAAQTWRVDVGSKGQKVTARMALLVSGDKAMRQRMKDRLLELRWTVREAGGGAEAMAMAEAECPEALVMDSWLPDLEAGEFAEQIERMYPGMDLLWVDGTSTPGRAARSPRRNELLHVIRATQEEEREGMAGSTAGPVRLEIPAAPVISMAAVPIGSGWLPDLVGESAGMRELARMIRLVAPRNVNVLIEGETGTGKELVAKAVHRLSLRSAKPFVVLNCAAIPEALLEAELFGHTRGAFTGAVTSRKGRIETADGGTLFLDEIGEMPLALQAKMLRFLECGELQKVGENETVRVDVRVVAATHQELERRAEEKTFRLDLYHRLAVFPVQIPALRDRMEDLPALVSFFLEQMGRDAPLKAISEAAMGCLREYPWPGNVRELMHVLQRGAILAEGRPEIGVDEIRVRMGVRPRR